MHLEHIKMTIRFFVKHDNKNLELKTVRVEISNRP